MDGIKKFVFSLSLVTCYLLLVPTVFALAYVNPIGNINSISDFVLALTKGLIVIVLPLATIALVITGLKFITASVAGDAKKLGEAKKALGWILIGSAVAIGSLAIAQALVNLIKTPF